jgi:hypothetical protein
MLQPTSKHTVQFFFEKLTVRQIVIKFSDFLLRGSVGYSQQPAFGHYPELLESNQQLHTEFPYDPQKNKLTSILT